MDEILNLLTYVGFDVLNKFRDDARVSELEIQYLQDANLYKATNIIAFNSSSGCVKVRENIENK